MVTNWKLELTWDDIDTHKEVALVKLICINNDTDATC